MDHHKTEVKLGSCLHFARHKKVIFVTILKDARSKQFYTIQEKI